MSIFFLESVLLSDYLYLNYTKNIAGVKYIPYLGFNSFNKAATKARAFGRR